MPLKGIKVLELAGLAPGPFCGMVLSDFGATVTRIDKTSNNPLDVLQDGKRRLGLNLKDPQAQEIVKSLSRVSDVLIEPFRPGVMEKLGLGPDVLLKENPRLIYARLTGFGQSGMYANRAGHDINYVAVSGILSMLGRYKEKPTTPINYIADFAGGGLLCSLGICIALLERHNSGYGQIIDASMVEGAAYVGSWLTRSQSLPIWGNERGRNIIDTGAHFYDTYRTKDGKYMSVGAIEPQFYEALLKGLKVDDVSQYENFETNKVVFEKIFAAKTQKEWCDIFDKSDACVFPVLDWNEASEHPHNKERQSFIDAGQTGGSVVPNPAPRLSRSPGKSGVLTDKRQTQAEALCEILAEIGLDESKVQKLIDENVIMVNRHAKSKL